MLKKTKRKIGCGIWVCVIECVFVFLFKKYSFVITVIRSPDLQRFHIPFLFIRLIFKLISCCFFFGCFSEKEKTHLCFELRMVNDQFVEIIKCYRFFFPYFTIFLFRFCSHLRKKHPSNWQYFFSFFCVCVLFALCAIVCLFVSFCLNCILKRHISLT